MSGTLMLRMAALLVLVAAGCASRTATQWMPLSSPTLDAFVVEAERPGHVAVDGNTLDIDVPAGCTVWLRHELRGLVQIDYDAVAVSAGGPNDRVSDLNCFWMATDPSAPGGNPLGRRGGKFSEYDTLKTYYVGLGGNANTTTRFRRYIGQPDRRPLLPQNDRRDARFLLKPNVTTHIRLIADGRRVEYWRDGERLFALDDDQPYTHGWFAIRTVTSHLRISNLLVSSR